ncbi:hypothetical protein NE237_030756 [Protea cynaroides]|uniref:ABCC10-like N-terminal domain-containing protein n=1 Tax=Protea cynaroides TaxID=273540 RepID=A0A9Q0GUQ9_9MAGN|nr:hypothetical protein NE237_030756 [Protea cynaroides]
MPYTPSLCNTVSHFKVQTEVTAATPTNSLRLNHYRRVTQGTFSFSYWVTLPSPDSRLFGILCVCYLLAATVGKQASVRILLDVLSLPGAILLLLCSYKVYKYKETGDSISSAALYTPLNGQSNGSGKSDFDSNVTPFADAGFMSKMSFWWLNPLMRKGREKTLEEEDKPRLSELDTAETCYTLFMEQLNKQKQSNLSAPCHHQFCGQ